MQQLQILKDVHTATCKETKGLGHCPYCDELFHNSKPTTNTSSKKNAKKNIIDNKPSLATKNMIYEESSARETNTKDQRKIRLDYLELLRKIWHNSSFLQFDAGTIYSTVSGKNKNDIVHQIAESFFQ